MVTVIKPTFGSATYALALTATIQDIAELGLRTGGLAAQTTAYLLRELAVATRCRRSKIKPERSVCSVRSRSAPLDLRWVGAIKPTPKPAASAAMSVSHVWDS